MTLSRQARGLLVFGLALTLSGGSFSAGVIHAQIPSQVKHLLNSKECARCDLQKAQLVGKDLNGAILQGADFRGAFLAGTTLRKAALKGASFFGADLKGADLTGATDANLVGAVTNEQTICPGGQSGPCAG